MPTFATMTQTPGAWIDPCFPRAFADHAKQERVMAYYISKTSPEILDPADAEALKGLHYSVYTPRTLFALGVLTGALGFSLYAVRRKTSNIIWLAATGAFAIPGIFSGMNSVAESDVIFKSSTFEQLAKKYRFSVYDFFNSKREHEMKNTDGTIKKQLKTVASYPA